ncbi:MAG: patatin-like phospholipase family protein [Candidatus Thiodiazotropha taylori]|nr:patatin-like phospholipase family protein [Candidatus Thiodiazotropha taylori]
MNQIRILSIDGGGIRGIIPAIVIAHIEEQTGCRAHQLFDLIAGTSTGGILALALTRPTDDGQAMYAASELVRLFESDGRHVFSSRRQSLLKELLFTKLGSNRAPYKNTKGLKGVLNKYFEKTYLSEALTEVMIPSYDIERRIPLYFSSSYAKKNRDFDHAMRNVARATSAAPTYFEPKQLFSKSKSMAMIDGGIFANNPALSAYIEAKTLWPGLSDDNYVVVSIGTGQHSPPILVNQTRHWGLRHWATKILDVTFDSVSESIHSQMQHLLPPLSDDGTLMNQRYFRFQVNLEKKNTALDNASEGNIKELRLKAERLIRDRKQELLQLSNLLNCDENNPING